MQIDNFMGPFGVEKSVVSDLLDNLDVIEMGEEERRICVTEAEARILVNSMKETLRDGRGEGIPRSEYRTRVGAAVEEVQAILAAIESVLRTG